MASSATARKPGRSSKATTEECEHRRATTLALVRCVFGNPFRPVHFSSEWRTDGALPLTRTMYESRDFSATPILADAPQDAGRDNEEVLSHHRAEGSHVRGCWVVDLVLGRSEAWWP